MFASGKAGLDIRCPACGAEPGAECADEPFLWRREQRHAIREKASNDQAFDRLLSGAAA